MALAALSPARLARLTASLYAVRGEYEKEGLSSWEVDFFATRLPAPPARLLIGGAGSGREVRFLAARGYECVAFDPAPSFVRAATRRGLPAGCRGFLCGSYEDLVEGGTKRQRSFAGEVTRWAPFDAVILGWGSLTHVATAAHRRGLFHRLRELAPSGPVLASYWLRSGPDPLPRGRAWLLGWRLGLGARVGDPRTLEDVAGDEFTSRAGFGHYFTVEELAELAQAAGYDIVEMTHPRQAAVFPHATFMPSSPARK